MFLNYIEHYHQEKKKTQFLSTSYMSFYIFEKKISPPGT